MALWEETHGERIVQALSVGDLGIFRSFHHMDRASQRWARKHPEELGFSKLFFGFDPTTHKLERHPMTAEVLSRARADLHFVPGNHEDHQYLGMLWERYATSLDQPIAVDRDWEGDAAGRYDEDEFWGHGRIHVLPQSNCVAIPGPLDEVTWEPRYEVQVRALNALRAYTMRSDWSTGRDERIDILLTHETYKWRLEGFDRTHRRDDWGSGKLRDLILRAGPRYHFFGHHHRYYPEVELSHDRGGVTRSVGLNQVIFQTRDSNISQGSFGILHISDPDDMRFEIVDDDWYQRLRYADCAAFM